MTPKTNNLMEAFTDINGGTRVELTTPNKPGTHRHNLWLYCVALSRIKRFCGHAEVSVAEHSLSMALAGLDLCYSPLHVFALITHDLPEAVTGDITKPVQDALGGAAKRTLASIQSRLYYEMASDLLVDAPEEAHLDLHKNFHDWVKPLDIAALVYEHDNFFEGPSKDWSAYDVVDQDLVQAITDTGHGIGSDPEDVAMAVFELIELLIALISGYEIWGDRKDLLGLVNNLGLKKLHKDFTP